MSSSYTDGTRVALDITDTDLLNSEAISEVIQCIRNSCGNDVPLSTHLIETESNAWSSVAEYDPFFDEVECTKSVEEFTEKIKKGRILIGLDVAAYILSKIKCTHLSLEKLVYFAYADYLCKYSDRLFDDKIFAFTHGPVIESVYEAYKRSGSQYVQPLKFDTDSNVQTNVKELPARSRILFAENGFNKLNSINSTIHRYGECSSGKLVDITHRENSPWSHVDSSIAYQVISDKLIKKYHHVECL